MKSVTTTLPNRRHILLGLAAASMATVSGEAAISAPPENTELLRLADLLPDILGRYIEARNLVAQIYRETNAVWPRAPKEIHTWSSTEPERDITGATIEDPDCLHGHRVGRPQLFQTIAKDHKAEAERISKFKRVWVKQVAWHLDRQADALAAIPLAEYYWARIEHLRASSGYDAAVESRNAALESLRLHISATLSEREVSIVGLVIKAQALGAWSEVDRVDRVLNADGPRWADQIAQSIISLGEAY